MGILSVQSHVVYGFVGNKSATFPLQSMGYDVWPVNTVQFSTHTGYNNWKGEIFSRQHIRRLIDSLLELNLASECQAILSGYMGSEDTCQEVYETVARFKKQNKNILYLCDPVIGNTNCFVKPEVLDFFKHNLKADIITPNQFEAEILSGMKIIDLHSLKAAADYFHNLGIKVVIITGVKFDYSLNIFVSNGHEQYLIPTQEFTFQHPVNGTGDLFSAIFLGTYLATKNALKAALNATYYMNLIIKNTFKTASRELQVLSSFYEIKDRDLTFTKI